MGVAWMVIVAVEMLSGGTGIGFYVWDAYNASNLAGVTAAIVLIGLVGLALDMAFIDSASSLGGNDMALVNPRLTQVVRQQGRHADTCLRGVDLAISPGEFVCVIGHSGCGKSTLLNLVAGLDTADGGTISLDGDVVTEPGPGPSRRVPELLAAAAA